MTIRPDIGLVGRKRVGKDTAARHLDRAYGYTALGFADPLRRAVEALDPIVDFSPGRGLTRYRDAVAAYGYEGAKDLFPEFRRVLQGYGVGLRDTLGEDVWVDALLRRVRLTYDQDPVVVTDCRFPNEAKALKGRGFVLVRITRETGLEDDLHPSETALDGYPVDHVIANDGTPEDLFEALDRVIAEHSL